MLDNEYLKYNDLAEILKVLAHPIRLCIVSNLLKNDEVNVTKMQECLKIPQSTLSQHLQKLRSVKIIEGKRNGLEIKYHITNDSVKELIKSLTLLKSE